MSRSSLLLLPLLLLLSLPSPSASLSFKLPKMSQMCFHEITHKNNKVLAFFDITAFGYGARVDLTIKAPDNSILEEFKGKDEGRAEFFAAQDGEYHFCFDNGKGSDTEVSFWVNIESGTAISDAVKEEHVNDMVFSVERLASLVSAARVDLEAFKARESKHRDTAESNRKRVMVWSGIECALIVMVAMAQVYRIRKFFESKRSL